MRRKLWPGAAWKTHESSASINDSTPGSDCAGRNIDGGSTRNARTTDAILVQNPQSRS